MSEYVGAIVLAVAFPLLFSTAFLVVVAVWSRGRVRVLGVLAATVMVVQVILNGVLQVMAPTLQDRFDLPISTVSGFFGLLSIVGYVGTGLVAAALVIGGRAEVRAARAEQAGSGGLR